MEEAQARSRQWRLAAGLAVVTAIAAVVLGTVGFREARRTLCLSNQRRLSVALLIYAQDNTGCLPPVRSKLETERTRFWLEAIDAYLPLRGLGACPANPAADCQDTRTGDRFGGSYALNERFFGVFAPGPMAVEHVELPNQTVLLVEAGHQRADRPFGPPAGQSCRAGYWDTGEHPLFHPSVHAGKMSVSAADGHALALEVAHYSLEGHDPLLGRLGGQIYNWNGGFPNGNLRGAPRE